VKGEFPAEPKAFAAGIHPPPHHDPAFRRARKSLTVAGLAELIDLLLGSFLFDAVPFLDTTFKLGHVAFHEIEIVVRQLAPFLLGLTLDLFPFAFELILVHIDSPFVFSKSWFF
jgi:hypothetical protein